MHLQPRFRTVSTDGAILTYAGLAAPVTPASAFMTTDAPNPTSLPSPTAEDGIELIVDLSDRRLSVQKNGTVQAVYPVAIGMADWPTPQGQFQVQNKQTNPAWRHPITHEVIPPGPDNPLGSRWIGFWLETDWAIGFHGTDTAEDLGEAVSHGCIRLLDGDIQVLYEQVELGTVVIIKA